MQREFIRDQRKSGIISDLELRDRTRITSGGMRFLFLLELFGCSWLSAERDTEQLSGADRKLKSCSTLQQDGEKTPCLCLWQE